MCRHKCNIQLRIFYAFYFVSAFHIFKETRSFQQIPIEIKTAKQQNRSSFLLFLLLKFQHLIKRSFNRMGHSIICSASAISVFCFCFAVIGIYDYRIFYPFRRNKSLRNLFLILLNKITSYIYNILRITICSYNFEHLRISHLLSKLRK